ncbi:hypothetical protein K8I61_13625 [bacterium]|nr:hypothetical protein [bacterium]
MGAVLRTVSMIATRAPFAALAIAVCALMLAAPLCSSGDDDDDIGGAAGTPPPGTCDENAAPEILAIGFFANGEALGDDGVAYADDAITVAATYSDPDCNLGGGRVVVSTDGGADVETKIGDAACDAADLADSAAVAPLLATEGTHSVQVSLADLCGAKSGALSSPITIEAAPADDDDAGDDDTAADATLLAGEIRYAGEKTGVDVVILLYTQWLPGGTLPVFSALVAIPETGFPFGYEIDLDALPAGNYYVTAYFDAEAGDGAYNPAVDPTHSPWAPVTVVAGETATYNITLADAKAR